MKLERCLSIADLRGAARRRAHRMVFDYIDGGADDELTLRRNSSAFDDYWLHYKVLTGADAPDLSTTMLGRRIEVPFLLSPAAGHRLFHTDGERGVAIAAEHSGTIFSLVSIHRTDNPAHERPKVVSALRVERQGSGSGDDWPST